MIGRHRVVDADEARILRLEATVDQALTLLRDAALTHTANRELVNLALDATNTLRRGRP